MGLVVLLAALAATPALAQAPPVQNRANAGVTGVPNLLLPSVSAGQSDLCVSVQSAAYGSPVLGVTFDFARGDRSCRRIREAKALAELGMRAAAVQLLCLEPDVHEAMAAAGTPCGGVK